MRKTPPQLKVLKGNPGHRKIPEGPDLRTELPEPPDWLTGHGLKMWHEMAPSLHGLGMLNLYNAPLFAALCQEVKLHRVAVEQLNKIMEGKGELAGIISQTTNGNIIQNPLVGVISKRLLNIEKISMDFGLPPTRMGLPKAKDKENDKERFFS